MDDSLCSCTEPGYCPHFKLNLIGRLWDLSQMDNNMGRQYRALWRKMAATKDIQPPLTPPVGFTPSKPCNCPGK